MPMKKKSTLIYFVNNFQSDLDLICNESINSQNESFLTNMEGAEKVPSDRTIENILNFARSYEVFETEKAGYIEMNLN